MIKDSNMSENKFKTGDQVIIHDYHAGDSVTNITRVTRARAFIEHREFNGDTGTERGYYGSYHIPTISHATPDEIERINKENERRNLINQIQKHSSDLKYTLRSSISLAYLSSEEIQEIVNHLLKIKEFFNKSENK